MIVRGKMTTNFDYDIITLEAQPTSDYRYLARIGRIVRNLGTDAQVVPWHEHQIPEMWGLTQEEAYNKLENAIKEWIATQEPPSTGYPC
jgi:hypothetical protein